MAICFICLFAHITHLFGDHQMFERFRKIFVVGEKRVFEGIAGVLVLAKEANAAMRRMLEVGGEELRVGQEKIRLLEQGSDDLCFQIKSSVVNGAVSPSIQDNLLVCVELADDILDAYHYAARELSRASALPLQVRVRELDDTLVSMLGLAERALDLVLRMLEAEDLEQENGLRHQIQRLEEEGDDIKDGGFDRLYSLSPGLHYIQFVHYSELLHKFDDILDACEDISDLLVQITSSVSA